MSENVSQKAPNWDPKSSHFLSLLQASADKELLGDFLRKSFGNVSQKALNWDSKSSHFVFVFKLFLMRSFWGARFTLEHPKRIKMVMPGTKTVSKVSQIRFLRCIMDALASQLDQIVRLSGPCALIDRWLTANFSEARDHVYTRSHWA